MTTLLSGRLSGADYPYPITPVEPYHEYSRKRVSAPDESALILQTAYRLVEGMQELEGAGFSVLVALLGPLVSFALPDGDAGWFCGGA